MTKPPNISEATLRRVRDYAVAEPSFTIAFACWDMSRTGQRITPYPVQRAVEWMLEQGIVELIEDNGRAGKVYAYVPPKGGATVHRLHAADDERIGELRPAASGDVVPHTRARGSSGKPGKDRKRQEQGVRIKRGRQGT